MNAFLSETRLRRSSYERIRERREKGGLRSTNTECSAALPGFGGDDVKKEGRLNRRMVERATALIKKLGQTL